MTRTAALLSGQVDFVEAPSLDSIPKLKAARMRTILMPYPHNWNYQLRADRPPFKDLHVRQAANLAINRDEIMEILQGVATPGYDKFIESHAYYRHPVKYEFDPDKAHALLKAAGCQSFAFTVVISTSGSGQMQPLPTNELVKERLDAIGFQAKLVPMDWNALIDVWSSGATENLTLDAINFSLSFVEPAQGIMKNSMTRYWPPNEQNWGFFSGPEVDRLGEASLAEFDVAQRNVLIGKMHEKLVADAYDVFIVHDLNPRAPSPTLSGFVQAQSWFQDMTLIVVHP